MIKIKFQNISECRKPAGLDAQKWLNKIRKLLKKEGKGVIELYLVNPAEIKKLNKNYRGIEKETDVLSFEFKGEDTFPGDTLVGQIFLCPQIAQKQARDHGVSWKEECEFLLVHAYLHVFGFDHEKAADFKKMFELQLKLFPNTKWRDYVQQIYRESFQSGEF